MSTVNTQGNVGEAVRAQMAKDRKLRENRRKPSTVLSEDAAVQSPQVKGGPNPNDEGKPVRPATVESPSSEDSQESEPQADPEPEIKPEPEVEVTRPDAIFGGKRDWREYRLANGYSEEELEGKGRNALRDLEDR